MDAPDAADATEAVAPVAGVEATAGAGAVDAVAEVAAELKAGRITVDQAVDRLIEDAVARHVRLAGPDADAAILGDQLREELRRFAANDPHLAARIRRLTHAK